MRSFRPHVLALWLAGSAPFVAYVCSASGFAYWLDSGEFVAAAVQLDIAHPPGHPLSAIWGRLWCFLPLGSLSFRVAVGQAAASALASVLHCRATAHALRGLALDERLRQALALFAAWSSAATYALWFQAVRPEVYALQTLCSAAICERLLAYASAGEAADERVLVTAAGLLGLALTNHHLTAFLLVPAFLPLTWSCLARKRLRTFTRAIVSGALGLSVYLYLPLRAAHDLPANLGQPDTWQRFAWVVSARVYARDMGGTVAEPFGTRLLDVLALWLESFGAWPVLLAVVGLYVCLRLASMRPVAIVLSLIWCTDAGVRAWLGSVRANPDILGYLAPSFLVMATLAACALAVLWSLLEGSGQRRIWLLRVGYALPLSVAAIVPVNYVRSALGSFAATDDFDDQRVRNLTARAVVLLSSPQAVFRALELQAVEAVRPDLAQLPLPFLAYPGMSEAWLTRAPELAPVIADYRAQHSHLQSRSVSALAQQRPVFVELDTRIAQDLLAQLRPRGLLTQLSSELLDDSVASQVERTLSARLGSWRHETETARQLLWIHYLNALQLGAAGERAGALRELRQAQALHPEETRLPPLARALQTAAPFDPAPFLDFDSVPR